MPSEPAIIATAGRVPVGANDDAEASGSLWLLCRADAHLCAIPVEHVVEIMRPLPIERVAAAPDYVRGLAVIRGAAVPVLDTGRLVGGKSTTINRLVTVRSGSRTIALAAEEVAGVSALTADRLGELPPLLRAASSETIEAIGLADSELLFVLRAARIVPDDVLDRLDFAGALS